MQWARSLFQSQEYVSLMMQLKEIQAAAEDVTRIQHEKMVEQKKCEDEPSSLS